MDQLSKEQDGFYRTSAGFGAVVPKLASGVTPEGMKYFEFRSSAYSDIIRVEWPKGAPLALIDNDVAEMMVSNGYGYHPTEAMIDEYNKLAAESPAPPPEQSAGKNGSPPDPVAKKFPPEGWLPHPTAPGFFYKGQEVLPEADLRAR